MRLLILITALYSGIYHALREDNLMGKFSRRLGGISQGDFSNDNDNGSDHPPLWGADFMLYIDKHMNENHLNLSAFILDHMKEATNETGEALKKAINDSEGRLDLKVNRLRSEFKKLLSVEDDIRKQIQYTLPVCRRGMYSSFFFRIAETLVPAVMLAERKRIVLCDDYLAGGGWILLQRRVTGDTNFYRTWRDYKRGFGSVHTDFWFGNDQLARITQSAHYEMRVDVTLAIGLKAWAYYSNFSVGYERDSYKLFVAGFLGSHGDFLRLANGQQFSTKDRDNDGVKNNKTPCAKLYHGGWWYNACFQANLNGDGWNTTNLFYGPWVLVVRNRTSRGFGHCSYTQMMMRRKRFQ